MEEGGGVKVGKIEVEGVEVGKGGEEGGNMVGLGGGEWVGW